MKLKYINPPVKQIAVCPNCETSIDAIDKDRVLKILKDKADIHAPLPGNKINMWSTYTEDCFHRNMYRTLLDLIKEIENL